MAITKQQSEITANAIFKVITRATGAECYAVPSDSQPGTYYISCYDAKLNGWTCSCKHGEYMAAKGQGASCKHVRAAQTSIRVNRVRKAEEREPVRTFVKLSREEYCKEFLIDA